MGSNLTPEVKALVGTISDPETNMFAISREMVYDLADAIEYRNPLFLDIGHASCTRFKKLICPPLATWKEWHQTINYFGAGQEGILEIPTPTEYVNKKIAKNIFKAILGWTLPHVKKSKLITFLSGNV